jgi:phosphatidylserine/phosphatidylglycerophosphate/cardiolipin synthase-like enzyme
VIATSAMPSATIVIPVCKPEDPVRQVPINHARARLLGPSHDDALTSLAAKLWLRERCGSCRRIPSRRSTTTRTGLDEGERNPAVVESEEWRRLIGNPQVAIDQTGLLDSALLGHGDATYGKLHAKFVVGDKAGFIGTSNFDYRSMLYNNEMGFFFEGPGLREDLLAAFESLKSTTYRWGSAEWLEMRRQVMDGRNPKASPARKQRFIFKSMKGLGIDYLM